MIRILQIGPFSSISLIHFFDLFFCCSLFICSTKHLGVPKATMPDLPNALAITSSRNYQDCVSGIGKITGGQDRYQRDFRCFYVSSNYPVAVVA